MLTDTIRIADAIDNPKFQAGDLVVLVEGPHKYERGTFMRLKDDVEWAAIKKQTEQSAAILLHGCWPIEDYFPTRH